MLNYSKVLPIITRNNLPATIETAIHTSVIFHFIKIISGTTRYHKIDDIIICGSSNDDGFGFGIMLLIGGLLVFYNTSKVVTSYVFLWQKKVKMPKITQ